MQTHKSNYPQILSSIVKEMSIPIPYDDPLTIPVSISVSNKSWGDVESHTYSNGQWGTEEHAEYEGQVYN